MKNDKYEKESYTCHKRNIQEVIKKEHSTAKIILRTTVKATASEGDYALRWSQKLPHIPVV